MLKNLIAGLSMFCVAAMAGGAEVPYRELRALWDMSGFRFDELSQAEKPWLMLKITPGADSGTTSGLYVNVETGQLVREPGKTIEIVTKGILQQLARFDGRILSRDQESYSWGMPAMSRTRDIRRLLYSPFVSGGTVLSRFWGAASREGQFDPYCVVPEEWSGTLPSYLDLRRAQGDRWLKIENKEDRQRVTRQLAGENPIVALQAFRVLRVTDRLPDDDLGYVPSKFSELVAGAAVTNRALLITDLLREARLIPTAAGEVNKLLVAATELGQLRPIAAAARAVLDFGGGSPVEESKRVSREIMGQCSEAMKRLPADDKLKGELQKLIQP